MLVTSVFFGNVPSVGVSGCIQPPPNVLQHPYSPLQLQQSTYQEKFDSAKGQLLFFNAHCLAVLWCGTRNNFISPAPFQLLFILNNCFPFFCSFVFLFFLYLFSLYPSIALFLYLFIFHSFISLFVISLLLIIFLSLLSLPFVKLFSYLFHRTASPTRWSSRKSIIKTIMSITQIIIIRIRIIIIINTIMIIGIILLITIEIIITIIIQKATTAVVVVVAVTTTQKTPKLKVSMKFTK